MATGGEKLRLLKSAEAVWELAPNDHPNGVRSAIKRPVDVTFVDPAFFAVADSEGHRVLLFHKGGGLAGILANGDVWPNGIAFTRDNKLLIVDRKTSSIKVYDIVREKCVTSWELGIDEEEVTSRMHGVTVNSRGQVLVSDTGLHMVHVFTPSGELVDQFGSKGSGLTQLCLPFYLAVDSRDNMIVSDNMNYGVKVFGPEGNFQFKIGSGQEWGQRHFHCPYGVTVDADNNILVADWESHRVVMYSPQGELCKQVLTPAMGCKHPNGLAIGVRGELVVAEGALDYANVKTYQLYG